MLNLLHMTIFCALFSFTAAGQINFLDWSVPMDLNRSYIHDELILSGETDFLVLRNNDFRRKRMIIDTYAGLQQGNRITVDPGASIDFSSIEAYEVFGDKFLVIGQTEVDQQTTGAIQTYPMNLNVPYKRMELFAESDPLENNFSFRIEKSTNEKYLLIAWTSEQYASGAFSPIGYAVFNQDLTLHQRGNFQLPISDGFIRLNEFHISNDGALFAVATEFSTEHQKGRWSKKDIDFFSITGDHKLLHAFKITKDSVHHIPVNLAEKRPEGIHLCSSQPNQLSVVSLYGNLEADGSHHGVKGIVTAILDFENPEKVAVESYAFSQKTRERYAIGDGKLLFQKRSYDVINNLLFQELVLLEDGSTMIILDKYVEGDYDSDSRRPHLSLYSMVYKFSPEGKMLWLHEVLKYQQVGIGREIFMFSKCFYSDGKLQVYYNDHRSNYDENGFFIRGNKAMKVARMVKHRKSKHIALALAEIDPKTGLMTRKIVIDESDNGWIPCAILVTELNGQLLFPSYQWKLEKIRFGQFGTINN